jgi:hypothetical protein
MSSEQLLCACVVVAAAFVFPKGALAHAGRGAPVATNFEARIDGVTPPTGAVKARVVDGGRLLWLRVDSNVVVVVPGAQGEPLLRFDRAGVHVNLRSLTAQTDRIDRRDLRPDPNSRARPLWHRLTAGHAYRWHEHRLHALEPLARDRHSGAVLGRWTMPMLIDGRLHELAGTLVYRRPPSAWSIVLAVVAGGATIRALAGSRSLVLPAAALATVLVWLVRIGRDLYGRPAVDAWGYLSLVLTSLVGGVLIYGLLRRDESVRQFIALLVAAGCLYEGWTMFGVLTHGVALTALPTLAARLAVATLLGLGAGIFATTLYGGKR